MLKAKCGIILPMEVIKKYLPLKPYMPKRPILGLSKVFTLSSSKSSVMFLASLLILGMATPLGVAEAAWWNPVLWAGDAVLNGIMAIVLGLPALIFMFALQLILSISSLLAWLSGLILATVINLDIPLTRCPEIGGIVQSCVVDTGWLLVRDIVNMMLVAALVVISFGTMYRWEGYGLRKALMPLIAVALLVNFSKVIVGVVVDIPTIVMQIFLAEISGMEALTNSFSAQGRLLLDHMAGLKFLSLSGNIGFILKTIMLIIFQLSFAFILGLFALIFLMRYVALWIITILAPFAFLAYIFPSTKKFFNQWRDQLISWSFIGVTASFFLWLSKIFASTVGVHKAALTQASDKFTRELFDSNPLKDFVIELLPYAMLLMFLFAAFALSIKTNAMGASLIINQGKKLAGAARGWGTNALKLSGGIGMRMARTTGKQRLGRVGGAVGRRTAQTKIGKAIGGKIPSALKPGHVQRLHRARPDTWNQKSGLMGQPDKNGTPINNFTAWGNLTPEQQRVVEKTHRESILNAAGGVLGKPAGWARSVRDKTWDQFTNEEKDAIKKVASISQFLETLKSSVDKHEANYRKQDLSREDLENALRKEGDRNRKMALQTLIHEKGGLGNLEKEVTLDANGNIMSISERGKKQVEEMGKLKKDLSLFAEFPELIEKIYTDPLKQARKKKAALQKASKETKEHYDAMEHLEDSQLAELSRNAETRKEKIAAIQRLADRHTLDQNLSDTEQGKLIDTARQFNQEHLILRRYLHKTKDEKEKESVMGKMAPRDYPLVHEDVLKDKNQFEEFYKYATPNGIGQMLTQKELREELKKLWGDAANEILLKSRDDINSSIVNRTKSNSPLSIPVDAVYK